MFDISRFRKRIRARRTYKQLRRHFDFEFYGRYNPDVVEAGVDALKHYINFGWEEGRDPSPDFSTGGYLYAYPDVRARNINPFWHFIRFGQGEGRSPLGTTISHDEYALVEHDFDTVYYRTLFADGMVPTDPVKHYLAIGWREGYNPNHWFSTRYYLAQNPDVRTAGVNPFIHYLQQGRRENRKALSGGASKVVYDEQAYAVAPGPEFELFDPEIGRDRKPQAKVLAYYLPQFHAIPENDENWGAGFTEWRNVARGLPRFVGHVQPRIPRDLGFYNLDSPEVLRQQIEMAAAAGLFGFCFYYYWFGGHRVLEKPVEHMLADPSLDFPFALMWANENWTRTWDGLEKEVLLQQDYDPDKDEALIDDLARHFHDSRYIRIGDRPLFFIYRPGQIPNAVVRIAEWRAQFEARHGLSPLIMMAQGFGDTDPRLYGLDGAIEFPPHKLCEGLANVTEHVELVDKEYSGLVVRYDDVVTRANMEPAPDFSLIRTTTPYWDNEARRPGRSMVLNGSTPEKFGNWLRQAITYSHEHLVHGESIVAVNAWNEWAEGAYLEPDMHYGASYLNALSRAVHGVPQRTRASAFQLVLVGHDAHRHGAQILVENLARVMTQQFGIEVIILLCQPGPMVEEYESLCETHVLSGDPVSDRALIEGLAARGAVQAICNTTVSGLVVPLLKDAGFHVTSLVHELSRTIREYDLTQQARAIADNADRIVFPADVVRDSFLEVSGRAVGDVELNPQGLYKTDLLSTMRDDDGLRAELGLPENAKIVINVGYADLRKGFDRFTETGHALCEARDDIWFVWLGGMSPDVQRWVLPDVQNGKCADRFRFIGHVKDVERWYAAADVFFLSAREDPFPSVVLEAMAVGLPVVGFAGTGGCDALIKQFGALVEGPETDAAVKAISDLVDVVKNDRETHAQTCRDEIRQNYLFDSYSHSLLSTDSTPVARVSVIVPNFNYAHCLEERLLTVFGQSSPVFEIIVLDDASNDDSVAIIEKVARAENRRIEVVVNEENSGSPFKQWKRGLERARGDYIWIAEADDISAPDFLNRLMDAMHGADADLGFCDSWQINEQGQKIGDSYKGYANEIRGSGFDESFSAEGKHVLEQYLAVKNIILNVSSVVFRKTALTAAMERVGEALDGMKVAGDWRLYSEICAAGGRIVYEARALNGHRRHANSVTHALDAERHLKEIREMQAYVASQIRVDAETTAAQKQHLADARAVLEGAWKTENDA